MKFYDFKKKVIVSIVAGALVFQPMIPLSTISLADTSVTTTMEQTLEIGKVYEGFKLEKKTYSKDSNCDVYMFVHEKSGGQVIYADAADKNKRFTVTFKTPTVDNTGVNHIFEHTVLEGSEKFPVKSPFTEMSKRTVATYLNASTGYDYTTYPIASENNKDYDNLMRVYLDAVFAPTVVKDYRIFQQEGWRYEINPESGNLMFNGVVFNEMKGAMSNRYSVLFNELKKSLYPDTKYRFNSGGDPYNIVDLTHKQLASKHAMYYTPSNACMIFYGHQDIVSKLKYVNEEYYSKYDKKAPIVDLKEQKPFEKPVFVTEKFPAAADETNEKDSMLIQAFALSNTTQKDRLGLQILSNLLTSGEDSVLYKEFVKTGMALESEAYYAPLYYQPAFNFLLLSTSNKNMEDFRSKVDVILKDLVKTGFEKERLEAVFNSYEFGFKQGMLKADRGENTIDAIDAGFVKYDDPFLGLNDSVLIDEIKKEAFSGKYFEGLIEKYLLNNNHQSNITLEPDANYMANLDAKIEEKLNERVSKMSQNQLDTEKWLVRMYNNWQKEGDSAEEMATLPTLNVGDLELDPTPTTAVEGKLGDVKLIKHNVNTLGLTQLSLYFDLKSLTQKELEYLDLFNAMLVSGDSKNYTNAKLSNEISKLTTGLIMGAESYKDNNDISKMYPFYVVKTAYNTENAAKASELILEKLTNVNLDNKDVMKMKVNELVEGIQSEKVGKPDKLVSARMNANLTAYGVFNNIRLDAGYKTLSAINADFDKNYDETLKVLNGIYAKLFNPADLAISIATEEKSFEATEKAMTTMLGKLKKTDTTDQKWDLTPKKENVAFPIPAEVQFIEYGFNLNDIGEKTMGQDLVFVNILSKGYMYQNIRVKGGAYGGYMTISFDGTVKFITYRDPNLKDSVAVADAVIEYLKNNKPSQDQINNAIISVAGRFEQGQDLFAQTGSDATNILINYDSARREAIKKQILETKASDIDAFIAKLEKGMKSNPNLVVAGSKTQIDANKGLFTTIESISE